MVPAEHGSIPVPRRHGESSPGLDAALHALRHSESWQERSAAAGALSAFQSPAVVDALLDGLRDPSPEVASAGVDALSAQRDPRALSALQSVLANQEGFYSPTVRVAAWSDLARRLPAHELEPVIRALRDVDAVTNEAPGHVQGLVDRIEQRRVELTRLGHLGARHEDPVRTSRIHEPTRRAGLVVSVVPAATHQPGEHHEQ